MKNTVFLGGGGVKIELKDFKPVHDKCAKDIRKDDRCEKIIDDKELGCLRCAAYIDPSYWWDHKGKCPLASHVTELSAKEKERKRVGQQKQKKFRR